MARRVAIVGAALSDCGRVDDKSAFELHHQATSRALADAGVDRREVDGFMSHGTGALPPIELAEYLGLASHIDYIDSTGTAQTGTVQKVSFSSSVPSLTVNGVAGVSPSSVSDVS